MKKMTIALVFASALTGFSTAYAALPVEGSWGMRQAEGSFTFDMTFTIQNNTMTVTNVCSLQGHSATAHVSVPAEYDDRTVATLAEANDQESNDGVNCSVSLKPDRMNYQIVGSSLILSHEGSGEQVTLTRK